MGKRERAGMRESGQCNIGENVLYIASNRMGRGEAANRDNFRLLRTVPKIGRVITIIKMADTTHF